MLAVWDEPSKNPFFTTIFGSVAVVAPGPPAEPTAPGPFRLSSPGELARVLDAAGFTAVRVEPVPITYELASIDAHWEMIVDMAIKNTIAGLAPADVARLRETIARALEPFRDGERVHVPATPLCATGRKD